MKKIMTLIMFILGMVDVSGGVMKNSKDARIDKRKIYHTVPYDYMYERSIGIATPNMPGFDNGQPIEIRN